MAYAIEARNSGDEPAYRDALGHLVQRRYGVLIAKARMKMASMEDAQDVVGEVLANVMQLGFAGEHVGEFFAFVKMILRRRIADFYRDHEGDPEIEPFDGLPDTEGSGPAAYETVGEEGGFLGVEIDDLWRQAISGESERDARVIRLKLAGFSAAEVVEIIALEGLDGGERLSEDNVNTIYSRFRKSNEDLFLGEPEIYANDPEEDEEAR